MITIKVNKHSIDFFKDDKESTIYQIPRTDLGKTLNGSNFSLWINQLLSKNWAGKATLYELAKIIQKEVPENKIDWKETFHIIEEKFRETE